MMWSSEAEIDSRILEVLNMEPKHLQTVFDLREARSTKDATKFCRFWEEAEKFISEDVYELQWMIAGKRMTISLADHDEATCWNKTRYTREERDRILLESEKSNLLKFSYFGISDFPSESRELFEKTFGVVLRNPLKAIIWY